MLWGSLHAAGDAIFFNPLRCSGANRPGTRVFKFRLEAFDASLGIREGFLVPLPPHKAPGNRSTFTSHNWQEKRHHFVFKKLIGKMSFHKLFKYYILNSGLFGTFTLNNVKTGGSAIFIRQKTPARRCDCHSCNHLPRARAHRYRKIW